mmetsp:Transcript_119662/g.267085  ORF Transcript_119662/g.267085 Transcript_119662/m.267085 type:complete len:229 (+) Transcript_119662:36-722(+)
MALGPRTSDQWPTISGLGLRPRPGIGLALRGPRPPEATLPARRACRSNEVAPRGRAVLATAAAAMAAPRSWGTAELGRILRQGTRGGVRGTSTSGPEAGASALGTPGVEGWAPPATAGGLPRRSPKRMMLLKSIDTWHSSLKSSNQVRSSFGTNSRPSALCGASSRSTSLQRRPSQVQRAGPKEPVEQDTATGEEALEKAAVPRNGLASSGMLNRLAHNITASLKVSS